jgi:hypothetical protein
MGSINQYFEGERKRELSIVGVPSTVTTAFSVQNDQVRLLESMTEDERHLVGIQLQYATLAELEKISLFLNTIMQNNGLNLEGYKVLNEALSIYGIKNPFDLIVKIENLKKQLGIADEA